MAYASVLSAKHQMERLHLSFNPETKSIYEDLCSLATLFHEDYAQMKGNKLRFDPLEELVEATANKIEDLIEKAYASYGSCCLETSAPKSPGHETITNSSSSSSSQEFFQLTQEISILTEKVKQSNKVYQKMVDEDLQQQGSITAHNVVSFSSETEEFNMKIMLVVGLDSEVVSLLHWVWRRTLNLNIMAVVGDTSTCESTLLQIYTDPSVQHLFEHCLWVTLSQHCNLQELTLVLNHMGFYIDRGCEGMGNISLVDHLYRFLNETRYLIILHDVRSSEMLDLFRLLLPNDKTGSRIILTTSLSNVVDHIGKEIVPKHHYIVEGTVDEAVPFSPRFSEVKLDIYASLKLRMRSFASSSGNMLIVLEKEQISNDEYAFTTVLCLASKEHKKTWN